MSHTEITVQGTLNPDGTLQLDEKPSLLPGRVTVVLRPVASSTDEEGWWPYLQRVRSERESTGYRFLSDAEMSEHLQWLRDEDERIDRIYRELQGDQRQEAEKP